MVRIRESVHIQCTFRVIVSMTKTFYVSYSDINLSIHAPPLIAVKLEPIMYSTDIKWKMLRRRKKKKTFEDFKKSLRTRILPWLYGNGFTCNNQIFLFEILQIKWSIDKKCGLIKKKANYCSLVRKFIYWVSDSPVWVESFTLSFIHMYPIPFALARLGISCHVLQNISFNIFSVFFKFSNS